MCQVDLLSIPASAQARYASHYNQINNHNQYAPKKILVVNTRHNYDNEQNNSRRCYDVVL